MERHLPYGITQCYLPPDAGEYAPPQPQPDRLVLDLPTLQGWKAEFILVYHASYIPRLFTCPQTVTNPGSNHVIVTKLEVKPTT